MSSALIRYFKSSSMYPNARLVYRRFVKRQPVHPLQWLKPAKGYTYVRLGSIYGGWTLVHDENLHGSTIVSAGLGEDGSFDVEFAKMYEARVVVVDPTPRAVQHFSALIRRLGSNREKGYVDNGRQPVEAYDLRGLTVENFSYVPKALWNETTTVRFFEPANPEFVSHSIVDLQNNYSRTSKYLEVQALTMSELCSSLHVKAADISLIKLDIEGAEIEVLTDMLDSGINPQQILVEYDELNVPSTTSYERVDKIHAKLKSHGYACLLTDGLANFLYYRSG